MYRQQRLLAIIAAVTGVLLAPLVGAQSNSGLTVELDADSTRADGPNGVIEFSGITIKQGELSVRADHARSSGLDFEDSAWTFSGDVRFRSADTQVAASKAVLRFRSQQLTDATLEGVPLTFERNGDGATKLSSSDARLEFRDSTLARAYFRGNPVLFEQTVDERVTSSRADSLVYDAAGGIVTLQDNAWIGEGGREITGNRISYDIIKQKIVAASDESGQQRVRITISPPDDTDDAGDAPDPEPVP